MSLKITTFHSRFKMEHADEIFFFLIKLKSIVFTVVWNILKIIILWGSNMKWNLLFMREMLKKDKASVPAFILFQSGVISHTLALSLQFFRLHFYLFIFFFTHACGLLFRKLLNIYLTQIMEEMGVYQDDQSMKQKYLRSKTLKMEKRCKQKIFQRKVIYPPFEGKLIRFKKSTCFGLVVAALQDNCFCHYISWRSWTQ